MIASFPPIIAENPKILILGTAPSIQSLSKRQFYGHPQNAFWRIMFELFGYEYENNYKIKTNLIVGNNIALWDVVKHCEREGSLDSEIKNPVPNDLHSLYSNHSTIKHVFLNGGKAHALYKQLIKPPLPVPVTKLPSTSPANARMNFRQKLNAWSIILANQ